MHDHLESHLVGLTFVLSRVLIGRSSRVFEFLHVESFHLHCSMLLEKGFMD